jgi:hypothetical protein
VQSCGGYDSITAKHNLASEIIDMNMPVTILHIGDLDPSGEDMFKVISKDVGTFVEQMSIEDQGPGVRRRVSDSTLETVRIAVTRWHVTQFELPTAPKKETDSRSKKFVGDTVQCEAIPHDALN